jgi:hypothetical protein
MTRTLTSLGLTCAPTRPQLVQRGLMSGFFTTCGGLGFSARF